jgi:hypothetical protein
MLSDTSPEAKRVYYRILASMTPAERVAIAMDLSAAADELLRAAVSRRFPLAREEDVTYELLRARYGRDLANRVCGR